MAVREGIELLEQTMREVVKEAVGWGMQKAFEWSEDRYPPQYVPYSCVYQTGEGSTMEHTSIQACLWICSFFYVSANMGNI
jgi:hypothetical protein